MRISAHRTRARHLSTSQKKFRERTRIWRARASWVNDARICGTNFLWEMTRARHLSKSQKKFGERTRIRRASKFSKFFKIFNFRVFKFSKLSKILKFSNVEIFWKFWKLWCASNARHFLWEIRNEARTSFPIKNSRSPIELSVNS